MGHSAPPPVPGTLTLSTSSADHVQVRAVIPAILAAGCYGPHPALGAQCGSDSSCPQGQVCDQTTDTCLDPNGCLPTIEICGDGIDQDCDGIDQPCPSNDLPTAPIDVTLGGVFTADVLYAHADDVDTMCGAGTGDGHDVFYQAAPTSPSIYYFDTLASDFDSTIRVYPGQACDVINQNVAVYPPQCEDDACGSKQSQLAVSIPGGKTCIVVAQRSASVIGGAVTLNVVVGGRDAIELPAAVGTSPVRISPLIDTCQSTSKVTIMSCPNVTMLPDKEPDAVFFFTLCPGPEVIDADTCPSVSTFDTIVYVADATGAILACDLNSGGCMSAADSLISSLTLTGPGLFYTGVTGNSNTCGAGSVEVTFH